MQSTIRSNNLQSYQTILYDRALHPELFQLKARRVVTHAGYELEGWLMPGQHLLRFERGPVCCCELVTDQEAGLPEQGVVGQFFCVGEHDFDHAFGNASVKYMTTVQTEQLSDNLFEATLREMRDHAAEENCATHGWTDDVGANLSVLDIQRFHREIHVQAYHLLARGGIVLRTQTIFEIS